jgi:hypothetical protein
MLRRIRKSRPCDKFKSSTLSFVPFLYPWPGSTEVIITIIHPVDRFISMKYTLTGLSFRKCGRYEKGHWRWISSSIPFEQYGQF